MNQPQAYLSALLRREIYELELQLWIHLYLWMLFTAYTLLLLWLAEQWISWKHNDLFLILNFKLRMQSVAKIGFPLNSIFNQCSPLYHLASQTKDTAGVSLVLVVFDFQLVSLAHIQPHSRPCHLLVLLNFQIHALQVLVCAEEKKESVSHMDQDLCKTQEQILLVTMQLEAKRKKIIVTGQQTIHVIYR